MDLEPIGIGAGAASVIAALLRFLELRRIKGGNVKTSEAKDLWEESEKERAYLRSELDKTRAEQLICRAHVHELRTEVMKLSWIVTLGPDKVPDELLTRLVEDTKVHVNHLREEAARLLHGSERFRKTDEIEPAPTAG